MIWKILIMSIVACLMMGQAAAVVFENESIKTRFVLSGVISENFQGKQRGVALVYDKTTKKNHVLKVGDSIPQRPEYKIVSVSKTEALISDGITKVSLKKDSFANTGSSSAGETAMRRDDDGEGFADYDADMPSSTGFGGGSRGDVAPPPLKSSDRDEADEEVFHKRPKNYGRYDEPYRGNHTGDGPAYPIHEDRDDELLDAW